MLKRNYFPTVASVYLVKIQLGFNYRVLYVCSFLIFGAISMQVSRILYSFATAFRRSAKQTPLSATATPQTPDSDIFTFSVSLEIKEDDGKGYFRYRFFTSEYNVWVCWKVSEERVWVWGGP